MISVTGSTALTFRYFGVAASFSGLLYCFYNFGYVKKCTLLSLKNKNVNCKISASSPEDRNATISEPFIDYNQSTSNNKETNNENN